MESESAVELLLVSMVRQVGGWCPKWKGDGERGVPDRIVFLPDGRVFFVELKRPDGRLSKTQVVIHRKMARLNQPVIVLYSKAEVSAWMEDVLG